MLQPDAITCEFARVCRRGQALFVLHCCATVALSATGMQRDWYSSQRSVALLGLSGRSVRKRPGERLRKQERVSSFGRCAGTAEGSAAPVGRDYG